MQSQDAKSSAFSRSLPVALVKCVREVFSTLEKSVTTSSEFSPSLRFAREHQATGAICSHFFMSNAIAAKNMAIKLKIVQETRISKRIKDQMMKFKEL